MAPPSAARVFSDLIRLKVCEYVEPRDLALGISCLNSHWLATCTIDSLWIAHVPGIWDIGQRRFNNPHSAPVESGPAGTADGSNNSGASMNTHSSCSNYDIATPGDPESSSAAVSPRSASSSGKFGNAQSDAYLHVQTLRSRVNDISMAMLRKALVAVDVGRCVEKADWRAMLVAKIIFGDKPKLVAVGDQRLKKLYYPDWALKLRDGKATYYHAIKEAARTHITKYELTTIQWRFQFKQAQDEQGNVFPTESLPEVMQWTMQTNASSTGAAAEVTVQVENFPTLRFSKLKDGRWRMDNEYVFFYQPLDDDIGKSLKLV